MNIVNKKVSSDTSKPAFFSVGSVFVIKAVGAILGLLSVVILARTLGPVGYGEYAFVIAWLSILILIASIGMPQFVMRKIAISHDNESSESGFSLLRRSRRLVLFLSMLLSLSIFLIGPLFVKKFDSNLIITFIFLIFSLPIMTLMLIEQAAIRGVHQAVRSFVPESILRPLAFLLFIAIYFFIDSGLSTSLVFVFYILSSMLSLGVAIRFRRLFLPQFHKNKSSEKTNFSDYISLAKQGVPFLFLGGINTIVIGSATIIIGSIRGPEEAGIFSVSASITMVMSFVLIAVNSVFLPKMAKYFKNGQHTLLKASVHRATQYLIFITFPLALFFIFAGKQVLYLFGPEFTKGTYVLVCLSVGQLISISAGGMLGALNMSGQEQRLAKSLVISSLCSLVFGLMLTPTLGMLGAAISVFLGNCLWVLMIFGRWKSSIARSIPDAKY